VSWSQGGDDSASYPNSSQDAYGFTSTAQSLPVIPWQPEFSNFIAGGHEQIISTTECVWSPHSSRIRDLLLAHASQNSDIIDPIVAFLGRYFASRKHLISGLRASTIAILQSGIMLPLMQWQEGGDTEAMALFNVEESRHCNSLIHYGEGTTFQPDGSRWRNPRIKWRVRDFERLKALFSTLVPAVGRQKVPDDYLERRLFNNTLPETME